MKVWICQGCGFISARGGSDYCPICKRNEVWTNAILLTRAAELPLEPTTPIPAAPLHDFDGNDVIDEFARESEE